ncbi:transcription elongation factor A protein [Acrasis kona]|uniref:Transcription elongation factor A protein n=1 Tax=Acrasis kona TaxID=1008807 RepID=A0AAW2ZK33_9EUKA
MVIDAENISTTSNPKPIIKPAIQPVSTPAIQPVKPVAAPNNASPTAPKMRAKAEFKANLFVQPPPTTETTSPTNSQQPPSPTLNDQNSNPPTTPSSAASNPQNQFIQLEIEKKLAKTNDKMRDWARKKIAVGLSTGTDDLDAAAELACKIEDTLVKHYESSDNMEYKNKIKSISFNLGDRTNRDFSARVLDGTFSPEQLCTMQSKEMASLEMQKERRKLMDEKTAEAMSHLPSVHKSSLYRCGKCKKKECSFYQMQTRSADEPMTTYVTCHSCGNRWKC